MSENFSDRGQQRRQDRFGSDVDASADEVGDWIRGSGGTVLGIALIAIVVWFLAGMWLG